MEKQEAFDQVVKIIAPFTNKNLSSMASVHEDTRILEDLGVNSARLVDILLAFEDHFEIAIEDESADKIRTLGDAARMIVEKTTPSKL